MEKELLFIMAQMPYNISTGATQNFDAVISGHKHEKKVEEVNGTLAINPGTAHGFEGEATIAFLDTDAMEVEFVELDYAYCVGRIYYCSIVIRNINQDICKLLP